MKQFVLVLFALCAVPLSAHAADETTTPRFEGVIGIASSYLKEDEGYVASKNPVANIEGDWNQTANLSGWGWFQVGDRGGTEIEVGETATVPLHSFTFRAEAIGYFYPEGGALNASIAVGATVPVKSIDLDFDVREYVGPAYQGGLGSIAVSHSFGPVKASFGYAYNWDLTGGQDVQSVYGRLSIKLEKVPHAPTIALVAFHANNTKPANYVGISLSVHL